MRRNTLYRKVREGARRTLSFPASRFFAIFAASLLLLFSASAVAAPAIERWTTEQGLEVLFVEARELPMVDLRLVFHGGSARDGDSPGIATLVGGMLDKGADGMDADEIARRFESVGARFGAEAARDMAIVTLRSLTDPAALNAALDTFVAIAARPDFPVRDFERALRLRRVELANEAQNPGEVASKAFMAAVYGDHPYGQPPLGTEESLARIRRTDLAAFHKRHYAAGNGVLVIVGDLDRAGAEGIAARIAAALPQGECAPPLPAVAPLAGPKTVFIPFPSAQAHILIGQPGIRRNDPDFFSLYVGNHVFGGGGFTSRLVGEVRDKRGLAYSVYSYFQPMAEAGPFTMGVQTQVAQADDTAVLMRDLLAEFVAKGPAPKEVEASRGNISGGFVLNTSTNGKIAEIVGMMAFYGLPDDWLETYTAKVDAVTAGDVREAFARHVNPQVLVTVVVGGAAEAVGE